jgi:hypothetical protein
VTEAQLDKLIELMKESEDTELYTLSAKWELEHFGVIEPGEEVERIAA